MALRFHFCSIFLAVLFIFLLPAIPCTGSTAETRQYYIEHLDINVEVLHSGKIQFSETRQMRFDGSYTWLEQSFGKSGFRDIEDIEVKLNGRPLDFNPAGPDEAAPGEYSIRETDRLIIVRTRIDVEDEALELELNYQLQGAISVNEEWAQFYWAFLTFNWERPTEGISLRLSFPEAPEDEWNRLHAWYESIAEEAALHVEDYHWTFTANRIRAGHGILIRSIFPSAWIEEDALIPTDTELNPQAVQARLHAEAQAAEEARLRKQKHAAILEPLGYILSAFALAFAFFILYECRFNHPQGGGVTREVPPMADRPPSDLPPALVGKLMGTNYSTAQYRLVSTIFDLSHKGYFTLRQEESEKKKKPDFLLARTEKIADDTLNTWETRVLVFIGNRLGGQAKSFKEIFQPAPGLSFSFATSGKEEESQSLATWLNTWDAEVGKDALNRNWWVDNIRPMIILATTQLILLVIGLFLMIYLSGAGSLVPGLTLMIAAFAGGCMTFGLYMRTPEGEYEYKRWLAYREGLKSGRVSAEKKYKGMHIIYAIVLGVSGKPFEKLIASLNIGSNDMPWMTFTPGMFPGAAVFSSSISQAVSVSTTSVSTGSSGAVGGSAGGTGGGGGAG